MSEKLFLAYVDALDTVFDPALHTDVEADGDSFDMTEADGAVATITIEREQSGWAIMAADHPRFVLVSESMSGDPVDAVLIARGRIVGLPGDLFGRTQTIEIQCAAEDLLDVANDDTGMVDGPLITYARANKSGGPETSFLLDDEKDDDPATYLLGRTESYYYDPATLEISTTDMVDGELINLSGEHDHDETVVPAATMDQPPVSTVRMTLTASWTQAAQGVVDIASRFPGPISSMTPDFVSSAEGDMPGSFKLDSGDGWQMLSDQSRVLLYQPDLTVPFWSGRVSKQKFPLQDDHGGGYVMQYYREFVTMGFRSYDFWRVPVSYSYSQARTETVTVIASIDAQTVPGVVKELDLGNVSTVDLLADSRAKQYEPNTTYEVGDIVQYGDRVYRCTEEHFSVSFAVATYDLGDGTYVDWINGGGLPATIPIFTLHPRWEEIPTDAALHSWDPKFFDTPAGEQIIAHLVCRARRQLIDRLRCLKITVTYPWEIARGVTLKHRVRIEAPLFPGGEVSAIIGKVVGIHRVWNTKEQTTELTLAVCVGTGDVAEIDVSTEGPYFADADYLSDADYLIASAGLGVAGDTEYAVDADPCSQPVNVQLLPNPGYSVVDLSVQHQTAEQLSAALAAASAGRDPRDAVAALATSISVTMKDLSTVGTAERSFVVAAQVGTSPRGIDLVTGGEP